MKARITGTGALQVERAGVYKMQQCPFAGKFCGDWCPRFEESESAAAACGVPFSIAEDQREAK